MFAASKSGQVTGTTPPPPTPTNDPQFNYVTALITGDGTNGAQNNTFVDSSPNSFTVTRAGNTTQGSASPYGGNWSNYFNGSTEYFSLGASTNLALGAGNFTIEVWLNIIAYNASSSNIFEWRSAGGVPSNIPTLYLSASGVPTFYASVGSGALITGSSAITLNTWTHLAIVRNGTTVTMYLNGTSIGSATNSANLGIQSFYINDPQPSYRTNAYFSNVRMVIGTAVYTANFTPSTTPLTAISGTSLLTCQSPRFVDNSINNFEISATSSVQVQSFNPFEPATLAPISYSGYFDGTGDYLTAPSNAAFTVNTGDFTIEGWHYLTGNASDTRYLFDCRSGGGNQPAQALYIASGIYIYYVNGDVAASGGTVTANQWVHFALVRLSGVDKLYINGSSVFTLADTGNYTSSNLRIASEWSSANTNDWLGYISNFRFVKGTAVYTANFTPSTTPLTAVSGTSLLTCQSNYFVDNSANNFAITPFGNVKTTIQNPFGTTSYSQFLNGSSYLSVGTNAAFAFGTGDFTVECWIYATAASDSPIYEGRADGSTSDGFTITAFSSSVIRIYSGSVLISSSGTNYLNQWTHVAVCRVSGTTTLYINGVSVGTSASLGNNATGSAVIGGGRYAGGTTVSSFFTGYISNFRLVKGTAVYTANFNPPTAPLTAITGTSLLTCQNLTAIDNSSNAFTITNTGAKGSLANPFPFGTTSSLTTGYSSSVASGSVYLNSPTSYLSVANNAALNITSGSTDSFVCQFWVNFSTVSVSTSIVDNGGQNGASFSNWAINLDASRQFQLVWGDSGSPGSTVGVLPSTVIPVANTWYHIAFVKTNADWAVFINGTRQITFNGLNTASKSSSTPLFIGYGIASGAGGSSFVGCISNLQIYKGASASAPYAATSTTISVPTSPLTATTNTQLLTCQSSTSITDASTNAFTITSTGTPTPKIANPFGITSVNGSSIFLDGTGDYLTVPASATTTAFGTGDFTVEAWVYPTVYPHTNGMFLFDARTSGNPNNWCLYLGSGGSLIWFYNGATIASTANTFPQNRWYHIAYSRSGTTGRLFVNGVVGSASTDGNNYSQTTILTVGARYTQDYPVQGYMSSVRIVKGTALYKSTFVPPSAPVVTPSGTSLLLNGTNAGIFDNAMMSNYETVGNSQISTTVKKYGTGSMYFDGSASYLFAPTSNVDNLSKFWTSNFTVECWIYPTTTSGDRTIICAVYSWGAGANYMIELRSGLLFVQLGDSITMTSGTTSISANTWTHIALVRSGLTSTTFYVNGVSVATSALNWTANEDCPLTIGCFNTNGGGLSNYWLGYIDDLRITKGYARYVANFTPPTQAFPTY